MCSSRFLRKISVFVLTIIVCGFLLQGGTVDAAAGTWTQSDWTGGAGTSTVNQFSASSDVVYSTAGELSLSPDSNLFSNPDFEANLTGWTPNLNWWEAGGAGDVVAAYQAQGATNYAGSKVNLDDPGTHDAIDGAAPSWSLANGWTFAANHYLTTDIIPVEGYSTIVQFSNMSTGSGSLVGSTYMPTVGSPTQFEVVNNAAAENKCKFGYGVTLYDTCVFTTAGNLALSGVDATHAQGYRNGVATGGTSYNWSGAQVLPALDIGAMGYFFEGVGSMHLGKMTGNIHAVAIYSSSLSASEVTAIYTEMSSSLTQVSRDTGTTYDGSSGSAKLYAQTDKPFVQSVDVGDAETYTLEAYIYTDGSEVTDADAELYVDGAPVTTTYLDAGDNWYKLSADVVGINGGADYGVEIKAGTAAYIDDMSLWEYVEAGTVTSSIYDTGWRSEWGTGTWVNSGGGDVELRIRTSDSPTMAGAPNFATCAMIGNGSDFSAAGCANDGDQYVQYQLTLTHGSTPNVEDVIITYEEIADLERTGQLGVISLIIGIGILSMSMLFVIEVRNKSKSA